MQVNEEKKKRRILVILHSNRPFFPSEHKKKFSFILIDVTCIEKVFGCCCCCCFCFVLLANDEMIAIKTMKKKKERVKISN